MVFLDLNKAISLSATSSLPEGLNGETLFAVFVAFIFQVFISLSIVAFPYVIFSLISKWRIYRKAGEKGWACLIPIYSDYVFYKIIWGNARMLLLPIGCVLSLIAYVYTLNFTLIFISFSLFISSLCVSVASYAKLAKVFNKSVGFAVGLIFLPFIFMPILAFGNSQYVGNKRNRPFICNLK